MALQDHNYASRPPPTPPPSPASIAAAAAAAAASAAAAISSPFAAQETVILDRLSNPVIGVAGPQHSLLPQTMLVNTGGLNVGSPPPVVPPTREQQVHPKKCISSHFINIFFFFSRIRSASRRPAWVP